MNLPTILIVDDELDIRNAIKNVIEPRIRCAIVEAGNGGEAIEYMRDNDCDLLIMDIRMPEKDGIDVLDTIKDRNIPTIIVTAWDSEQVYNECRMRGVRDYVTKCDSLTVICDKVVKELKKIGKYYPKG